MRKSLILALTALGSGASYAAGIAEVATGPEYRRPRHLALACIVDPGCAIRGDLSAHASRRSRRRGVPALRAVHPVGSATAAQQSTLRRRSVSRV